MSIKYTLFISSRENYAFRGGLCMWGGKRPPDKRQRTTWRKWWIFYFCPLLYSKSVNINSATVTILWNITVLKGNTKTTSWNALYLSTLAQSTGHPCLMYRIRFHDNLWLFLYCHTVHCNLVSSHCKVHKTSTFTRMALCYHGVAYMYPWICLKIFTPNTLPMYFFAVLLRSLYQLISNECFI